MRAPFQILAIPFRRKEGRLLYCVFHRSDHDQWQFIAGGGEDPETPEEAAGREIFEESGVVPAGLIRLKSLCCVPASCFPLRHTYGWPPDTYVIPEYAFGFECREGLAQNPSALPASSERIIMKKQKSYPILTRIR